MTATHRSLARGVLAFCLASSVASAQGTTSVSLGGEGAAYAKLLPRRSLTAVRATSPGDTAIQYWRAVSALVRNGEKARALDLAHWIWTMQRPHAGDATFTRAVVDMLAYIRDDGALVIGAGVPELWANLDHGVKVRRLQTPYGPFDLAMTGGGRRVKVYLGGTLKIPAAGIVVWSPYDSPVLSATVNGEPAEIHDRRYIVVRSLPADILFGH